MVRQRLSSADFQRVRLFLEETSVPCDLASFGSILLPAVQKLVPSVVTCYAQFDPVEGRLVVQETYPRLTPPKDMPDFVDMMRGHPVIEAWDRIGQTPAMRRSQLLSRAAWHRRPVYQHLYSDWGCEDSLPVGLPAPQGLVACLCIERDVDYSDSEVQLIEFVRPYVGQMYRSAEMLSLINAATGQGGVMSMLLDPTGRPLLATSATWDLIAAYFPGHAVTGAVFPRPLAEWLLGELMVVQSPELRASGSSYVKTRADGSRLAFRLLNGERTGEQSLLVLHETRAEPEAGVPRALGLSRREEEVLLLVREGKSSAEIADSLFLSRRTIEKHLENIYCKLGVDNRTAAVTTAFPRR